MFNFIVSSYIILFAAIFLIGVVKASYHFDYLKSVKPKRYDKYPSFFSVFTFGHYNMKLQSLVFPVFKREVSLENEHSLNLAKKVKKTVRLHFLSIILMVIYIIGLIVWAKFK